ncbi:hypothetical protein CHS0354_016741 [Potamilus streckersoni]|uniref:Uncharacterized protein n=1 Tax=Potamilus streckersoni TaxID=2493646 RepID=A0AAE0TC50_9BIVA|nr:hypothetical protein CHS0354_016741 [Potamilus streckersoni]
MVNQSRVLADHSDIGPYNAHSDKSFPFCVLCHFALLFRACFASANANRRTLLMCAQTGLILNLYTENQLVYEHLRKKWDKDVTVLATITGLGNEYDSHSCIAVNGENGST